MTGPAGTRWYHRLSLRARMVLLTAAVVTVVLAAGGAALITAIRASLEESTVEAGRIRAADVAAQAADGLSPGQAQVVDDVEALVQVVAGDRVLSASENLAGAGPLKLPRARIGVTTVHAVESLPIRDTGPFRVVARGVRTAEGPATVYVAVSLDDVDDSLAADLEVGLVGLPVLVLVLSAAMWLVLGRTLAPVEAIRTEAAAITARDLGRRVPEPVQQDEIGRLARTVNAMLARLQGSAERQRRFVADAAHELRSPIASLRAQLETALEAPVERAELLPDLLQETVRMQTLVDQLLLLARSDAGEALPQLPVDLDDVVESAAAAVVAEARLPIELDDVRPVQVTGDAALLEQVVRNLLENAARHARHVVRVELDCAAGEAVLTVDDDGPGIPADRREEVFRRFARLDPARARDHGGVGLGLAIVADITRLHGGTVEVTDSPLGGARLRVRLPAPD